MNGHRPPDEARHELDGKITVLRPNRRPIPADFITCESALDAKVIPPAQHLVPGLIPMGLTVFSAPPKIGKTWFNYGILHGASTTGLLCNALPVRKGPVLILDLEGNDRRAQTRLRIVRNGTDPSPDLHIAHEWPTMAEGGLEMLREAAKQYRLIAIIIDVWVKFRPPRPRSADPYQHDYDSAKPLHELARDLNLALILTHHNRKAADADWVNEMSGSTGLGAVADTLMTLKRERGQADAVLHATGRDIEDKELAMSFNAGRWTILGDADEYRMGENRRAIFDCVSARPSTPKEIAEATGLKRDSVRQILRRMLRDSALTVDERGCYRPVRT